MLLAIALFPASALSVDSYFTPGISFFPSGDLSQTADDLGTRDPSPAFDGDFLLSFRRGTRNSFLAGFGLVLSKRTEMGSDVPFAPAETKAKLQLFSFSFTTGWTKRFAPPDRKGWAAGLFAHYYLVKASVENPTSAEGDPQYFRLRADDTAERNGGGPGVSLFGAYEYPFFLGRIGIGVKARWTAIQVDEIDGLGTPDIDLSGATLFISVLLSG